MGCRVCLGIIKERAENYKHNIIVEANNTIRKQNNLQNVRKLL